MKKFFLLFVLSLFIISCASAQEDEEWIKEQQRLISEGYATIFDTDAYKNGDYYIGDDGRVYIDYSTDTKSTKDKGADDIEWNWYSNKNYDYYSGYMGDEKYNPTPTPSPRNQKVTWKCVDATSYDGISNNDNKCTSSTGQVKYVSDSEARRLDPSYRPGQSGAWYYNNK